MKRIDLVDLVNGTCKSAVCASNFACEIISYACNGSAELNWR